MKKNCPATRFDSKKLVLPIFAVVLFAGSSTFAIQAIDGRWEGEIQSPRRPIVINVDFEQRSVSLFGADSVNLTNATVSGDGTVTFGFAIGDQLLKLAGKLEPGRIVGELEAGDQKIPFWLERLPRLSNPANHSEAWQQDIDVVITRFLRYDRSFTPSTRQAARARLQALRARVNRLSDQAIMVALARAIASSGNAHTRLYLMRNRTEVRRVPLRVWWFGNELRIMSAANEYTGLAGCQVTRIGYLPATSAFQKVRGIKAGNYSHTKFSWKVR